MWFQSLGRMLRDEQRWEEVQGVLRIPCQGKGLAGVRTFSLR